MKRVLLATTALCLGAGMAAADIAMEGSAEMGVAGSKNDSARFHTDVNLKFVLSGTTDAGVAFGTEIELSDIEDAGGRHTTNVDDQDGGIAVYMSDPDGFGTLTLGDTDGAYDWAMTELPGGGLRDEVEHDAHSGNGGLDAEYDNQILRYNRTIAAGFSFGASLELDDDTGGTEGSNTADPIIGLGGKYGMDTGAGKLTLGGGYQRGGYRFNSEDDVEAVATPFERTTEVTAQVFGGSAKMDFGGVAVTLNASMGEAEGSYATTGDNPNTVTLDGEFTHAGVGLEYTVGALSLALNVGSLSEELTFDPSNNATRDRVIGDQTTTGVGFGASYDLGGGASLVFGIGNTETEFDLTNEPDGTNPANTSASVTGDSDTDKYEWSLGVAFAF